MCTHIAIYIYIHIRGSIRYVVASLAVNMWSRLWPLSATLVRGYIISYHIISYYIILHNNNNINNNNNNSVSGLKSHIRMHGVVC